MTSTRKLLSPVLGTLLLLAATQPPALAQRPSKKLSLAELAALEWKLEQGTKKLTQHPDVSERLKALAELVSLDDPRTATPLSLALKEDPDATIRLKAAEALAALGSPEALGLLTLASTADPDPKVRASTAEQIKKFPKRMRPAGLTLKPVPFKPPGGKVTPETIKKILALPSGDARLWAVQQVAQVKFKSPKDPEKILKNQLSTDPSGRVRVEAAGLLARLLKKKSLPSLIVAVGDGDPAVRFHLARILAEFNDPGALSVVQKLASSDENETVRAEAKDLLEPYSAVGRRLLRDRIKQLHSANPAERIGALNALTEFTHWKAMVPMSCALLNDTSEHVRAMAAQTLQNMHDISVQIAFRVASLLERDKKLQATVRKLTMGLARQVGTLIKQLGSDDAKKRVLAARALGQGGYPQALDPLIRALKDKDDKVRLEAAQGIRGFAEAKAVDALKFAMADKEAKVREVAERYFQQQKRLDGWRSFYKDPNRIVTKTLDKDPLWRADAAIALGISGADGTVINLIQLLVKDKVEEVRLAAAWALVLMASEDAESALKKAAETDPSNKVKLTARKYLVISKVTREDLIQQISDPGAQVRQDAAEALSLRANSQVLHPLIRAALCDPEPKVRASSLRGLARIANPLAKIVIKMLMNRDLDKRVRRSAMIMHILVGGK